MAGELIRRDAPPVATEGESGVGINPLKLVPKEYRKPVNFFWMLNQHLLPNPLPLCARVKRWIATEGLTEQELADVLAALSEPEASARHRFAGDLLADLAAKVAVVVRRRQQIEKQLADREAAERLAAGLTPEQSAVQAMAREVKAAIGSLGRM